MPPSPEPPDDELTRRAKARVGRKLGFYIHVFAFVLANLGLAAVNAFDGRPLWHLWSFGWWGLGLALHGLVTFAHLRGDGIRARMLAAEIARLKQQAR
jgi:2TM domain